MLHYHISDPAQLDLRPKVAMRHPRRVYARYADAAAEAARLRHENDAHGFSVATCGTPPEWATQVLLGNGTVRQIPSGAIRPAGSPDAHTPRPRP